jgi:cytochrome c-type biogenesis protein CcmH
MRGALCAAVWLGAASAALAVDSQPPFDDPALQARYETLIHEVRCLVCQNETIADSQADLAGDLRREIHEMIADGKSDEQIVDFLTARYGDFVMYRPPLEPRTWLLWGGPGLLLLLGAGVFARIVYVRSKQPLDEDLVS